jgi:hypothetical protein
MRLVHPHFGYMNRLPNQSYLKYTHEQLFEFIQNLGAVSRIREAGFTLHSSELLSFVFWKTITAGQPRVSYEVFADLMNVFKFNLTQENLIREIKYSTKEG